MKDFLSASAAAMPVPAAPARLITFGHGARHLVETGLAAEVVNNAIETEIRSVIRDASATGSFWGRITVEGTTIEYRAFTLPNGTINVGTYYPIGR
ncbi:MAG: hypothetical protein HYR76_06105 [Ignavibacteria bacterium]|nr:hypothetical protein [Ignavibacteria bacterium]MBI3764883.1 hypothetical protein [Ignavibacteriales bacterium]